MKRSQSPFTYHFKLRLIFVYSRLIDERAIKLHQHLRLDDTGIVTPVHLNFKLTSETDCMELLEVRDKRFTTQFLVLISTIVLP